MIQTKYCTCCKQTLPVDKFCRNIRAKDGCAYHCKSCIKDYQISIKAKLQAYQHEYQKVYRKENYEILNERASMWSKNNPEKAREHVKRSKARNPEYYKNYMKQYRLRKKLLNQPNA